MDQLRRLISGLSLIQRISILGVAALVIAGLVTFSHYRHEGDFHPLYTAMAPEDAATVVQKLKESAVEYRLSENGGTVLVPSGKLAESRLALAAVGLPKSGRIGFELFDKNNFGATEFVEHINYKRALEGELERSVMSLAEVEQARIHLTLPKESVFLDAQEPAKASVMVKLRAGAQISPQNVIAVTNLVASAVEGLSPEAVSLVDMDGNLLSKPHKKASADGSELTAESMEVRLQLEKALVTKISATLEPLLGANRFRAGASVDCDLTSGEQQEETLDPAKSVMLSSQKTEEGADHPVSGGVPGTASNLPNPPAASNKTTSGVARRTENITYQTSRTVRTMRIPQGVVKRMSLAVLVDQAVQWEGEGAAKKKILVPPTPETLKTIRDLVAGVTGFNQERGDQLIVESLPFESSLNAQPPQSPRPIGSKPAVKEPPLVEFYNKYRDLTVPAVLGLVLLMALAFGIFKVARKKKGGKVEMQESIELPAGSEIPGSHALPSGDGAAANLELSPRAQQLAAGPPLSEADRDQLADRIRVVAKRDPAATANVLRMWMQDKQT
jgi:flagellar M-ring protein FliF